MLRVADWVAVAVFVFIVPVAARSAQNIGQKKKAVPAGQQAAWAALIQLSPEDFIKRFDKNADGALTKDELPPRLVPMFDKFDQNQDGKLDVDEVEQMLKILRQRFADNNNAKKADNLPNRPEVEKMLAKVLEEMDTNKDGKISRQEATGSIAANFDRIDANKDGFLDKNELRRSIARFLEPNKPNGGDAQKPKPQAAQQQARGPDFDALDANADGRLTRDELKGSLLEVKFDEIDTNKDGKIDRKEFAAYLRKQAEKK